MTEFVIAYKQLRHFRDDFRYGFESSGTDGRMPVEGHFHRSASLNTASAKPVKLELLLKLSAQDRCAYEPPPFSPQPINWSRHFHLGMGEMRKPLVSLRDRKTRSHFHPRSAWAE
ncbi:hypothetical protein [Methylobacterium fujisawaense]|uniref:hypothetical protein n=1 Tax=Methylobacterium fujisawaense TaxID=107400 RepID=UPI00244AA824|nr:hypothetical protein [Methylobacterium fujisawaense]MDH3030156.1 hypothetical protein [Methylobacterium fujisawaense]